MAISVSPDARMQGKEDMTGVVEEIYLPGPNGEPDGEGPYQFEIPRMGKILKAQRKLTSMKDVATILETGRASTEWLAQGFGPEAWAHIVSRMDDDDDILDDEHMQWLFTALTKEDTGRPTTSSNGASRQPWKRPSGAAPSTPVSDSES